MFEEYTIQLLSNVSQDSLANTLLKRIESEWTFEEITSSVCTTLYTFEECSDMCFFVSDSEFLYFCGPINIKRNKTPTTTLWTFDYLYYIGNSYHIIKSIPLEQNTLPKSIFPDDYICCPYLLTKYNDKVIMLQPKKIYIADKMQTFYLVSMHKFKQEAGSIINLSIYTNNHCLMHSNHILDVEPSISNLGTIYYQEDGEPKYKVYDIITNTITAERSHAESYYITKELMDYKKLICMKNDGKYRDYEMTSEDKYLFNNRIPSFHTDYQEYYFSVKDPITEILINTYFAKKAIVKKIGSEFEDDFSHNYCIQIESENKELIYLWKYICRERLIREPAIYGVEICQIILYIKEAEYLVLDKSATDTALKAIQANAQINYLDMIKGWMARFPYSSLVSIHGSYLKYRDSDEKAEYYYLCDHLNSIKKNYYSILQQLAEEGKIAPRWRSEFSLFILIKSYFPTAEYQYRTGWLGNQSLDIFVPDLNLGFEYQGLQHYEPVELFGGMESLKDNQKRDAEKREKCKKNGMLLLEWPYWISVDDTEFQKLMKENNITISKKHLAEFKLYNILNNESHPKQTNYCICQFDLSGVMIKKYSSIKDAEIKTGIRYYNIKRACSGFRKTAGGYQWRELKECEIKNISPINKDNPISSGPRSVTQYDSNGSIIKNYESIAEATRKTGVNSKSIRDTANGKQNQAGGFIWKYNSK